MSEKWGVKDWGYPMTLRSGDYVLNVTSVVSRICWRSVSEEASFNLHTCTIRLKYIDGGEESLPLPLPGKSDPVRLWVPVIEPLQILCPNPNRSSQDRSDRLMNRARVSAGDRSLRFLEIQYYDLDSRHYWPNTVSSGLEMGKNFDGHNVNAGTELVYRVAAAFLTNSV